MTLAEELESLAHEVERGHPQASDLRELPELYRRAVAEVAAQRAQRVPLAERGALEAAVVLAHGVIYAPNAPRPWTSFADLVLSVPAAVRSAWASIVLAFALLALGTAWGYGEVVRSPQSAETFLSAMSSQNADRFGDENELPEGDPLVGAFYFAHNSQVAFFCFALGVTFGVGTALFLLFNGILLGATAAAAQQNGALWALQSWLLPHAVLELSAIAIAAAGGFKLAEALLWPGFLRRRDALAAAAAKALPLALGACLLLAIAGLAEAWIAPQKWAAWPKAAIGLSLDLLLLAYIFGVRRRAPSGDAIALPLTR